jgi:hypothetical protein
MKDGIHCFWHQDDTYTLTSKGFVWCYPEADFVPNCVWNQPEWNHFDEIYNIQKSAMSACAGICTDYPMLLRDLYDGTLLTKRDY